MTRKSIPLLGAFLLISLSPITAQKVKVDTVYYNGNGELVEKKADYLTYEVRSLDRKKRIHGVVGKFAKTGRLLEAIEYTQGEKTGAYERFHRNGKVMVYGNHEQGKRVNYWVTLDQEGIILSMEEYDKKGELLDTRNNTPFNPVKGATNVLIDAEFPGGKDKWNEHLWGNLKYPNEAKRNGHQGTVFIDFVVLSDGQIVAPRITSSPDKSLSNESLRMLQISPKWNPAKLNGKSIDSKAQIRVVFRLK